MVKAALFDIDGTLIDSNDLHAEAWRQALADAGHAIPAERVCAQIGKGGDNLLPALVPGIAHQEAARIEAARSDLFRRDFMPRARPFAGVRPLFERLVGDGWRIVLATSSGAQDAGFLRDLTGAGDLIHGMTSSDDAERSKPCPDIFRAGLALAGDGARPARAVAVGDTPYDIAAAAAAGIPAIGLLCGGFPAASLADAIAVYRDPADLLARYETSPLCDEPKA